MPNRLVPNIWPRGPNKARRRIALAAVLLAVAASVGAGDASVPAELTLARPSSTSGDDSIDGASTSGDDSIDGASTSGDDSIDGASTSGDDSHSEASTSEASESQDSTAPPWRCAEGDEPRVVTPGVTAPATPFRGHRQCRQRLRPRLGHRDDHHRLPQLRGPQNTELRVAGIKTGGPMSVRADSRDWSSAVAEGRSRSRIAARSSHPRVTSTSTSGVREPHRRQGYYRRCHRPVGRHTSNRRHTPRCRRLLRVRSTEPYTFATHNGLGGALFDIGAHANGIHIVAGEEVGAY